MIGLRLVVTGADRRRPEAEAARLAAVAADRVAARRQAAQRPGGESNASEAGQSSPHVVFIR